MNYKEIKRLTELVSEYRWDEKFGLMVWITYDNCEEVFCNILNVDFESYVNCVAQEHGLFVAHFEEVLSYYISIEDIEDIFPKED